MEFVDEIAVVVQHIYRAGLVGVVGEIHRQKNQHNHDDRHEQRGDDERLLLDTREKFARDNDQYFVHGWLMVFVLFLYGADKNVVHGGQHFTETEDGIVGD